MSDLAWVSWESQLAGLPLDCSFSPQLVVMEATSLPAGKGRGGRGGGAEGLSEPWVGSPGAFRLSRYVHQACYSSMCTVPCILAFPSEGAYRHNESLAKEEKNEHESKCKEAKYIPGL